MAKKNKTNNDHRRVYLSIVGIVAIVAAVVLVMNFSGKDSDDSALTVDKEGNIVGEAGKIIIGTDILKHIRNYELINVFYIY